MNLLGAKLYDPLTAASASTATAAVMAVLDTTNLRLTVTVPAHGLIRVRIVCNIEGATTFPQILLGVMVGAAVTGRVTPEVTVNGTALATTHATAIADFIIPGLTPGSTVFDAAYGVETVVASTNIKWGGPNNTSADDAWGAFQFEIWDPQPLPTATPGASTGLLISGSNSGTTTLGALTVTGALTISNGLVVARSSANTSAVTFTGNGTGHGLVCASGSGATGDGMQITALSTNGKGLNVLGAGSGDGLLVTGGSGTGSGAQFNGGAGGGSGALFVGGATGGDGITANGTVSHAVNFTGGASVVGRTGGAGLNVTGGAGAASNFGALAGMVITAGGTVTVAGNAGMVVTGTGAFSGATFDGGPGIAGDGITCTSHSSVNGAGLACYGSTSGPGIGAKSGTGSGAHGIHAAAIGSALSDGLHCSSNVSGFGIGIVTISGDGINVAPVAGHGLILAANGTSKHGIVSTGGTAGTSDGMKVVAGTGGVDFRGNINSLTIQKNTALSAFPFFLVKSSDHVSGATGMTVTATRRLDSGSFASCANAVSEVANGWYTIDLAAADLNGNTVALLFTATGADPRAITIVTQL